ncbi:MAG: hypothetical protein ACOYJ1_08385 [Peptococcales bacterium]
MKKINDRITLGIISGIIGNLAKETVNGSLSRIAFGRVDGSNIASGIFLPRWKSKYLPTKKTRFIGFVADNIIAGFLGVSTVYLLSLTGNDHHRLKGASAGHFAWTSMYGFLSKMGATSVYPVSENVNIKGLISHTVFGIVTSEVAIRLGDESLFKPSEAQSCFLSNPNKND